MEERGAEKGAGLNDFRRVMEHMEKGLNVEDAVKKLVGKEQTGNGKESTPGGGSAVAGPEEQIIDLELIKADPDKLYPLIYYAIKRKLKEWEQYMAERPGEFPVSFITFCTYSVSDHIKHSVQGKRAVVTQVQSGEYLKPLFKQLRQRVRRLLARGLSRYLLGFRISHRTCLHVLPKSCTICKCDSIKELMIHICG